MHTLRCLIRKKAQTWSFIALFQKILLVFSKGYSNVDVFGERGGEVVKGVVDNWLSKIDRKYTFWNVCAQKKVLLCIGTMDEIPCSITRPCLSRDDMLSHLYVLI